MSLSAQHKSVSASLGVRGLSCSPWVMLLPARFPADSGRKDKPKVRPKSEQSPQKLGLHSGGTRHVILEGVQSPGRLAQPGESSTCRAWPRSPALWSAAGTQSRFPCSTDPISHCLSTPLRPPCSAGYNRALGNGGQRTQLLRAKTGEGS